MASNLLAMASNLLAMASNFAIALEMDGRVIMQNLC